MKFEFDFCPGSTLYWPCDSLAFDPHLWVILTLPFSDPQKIVMVMLTSKRDYSDTTVVLNKGDHPFIIRPTVILYSSANLFKTDELIKDIKLNIARPREHFNELVLEKIKKGLLTSKFTPKGIKNICLSVFNFQPPEK